MQSKPTFELCGRDKIRQGGAAELGSRNIKMFELLPKEKHEIVQVVFFFLSKKFK